MSAQETTAKGLIRTIADRCRTCYTCVRECPAKAIRIVNGQAEVIPDRCISCGNCVIVCSQKAKEYASSIDRVKHLLQSSQRTAAIIAPSFPAEFSDIGDHRIVVGMIRALGFSLVTEVSFGADLVADRYHRHVGEDVSFPLIAANCPAVVTFVQKYHPALVPNLAPIVSPMIAMARVMKKRYGEDLIIVFIGPCIAKIAEARDGSCESGIAEVLTFRELRHLWQDAGITAHAEPSDFDPPHGGRGWLFPVSRGMLQSLSIPDDISQTNVLAADGRIDFPEALREFEQSALRDRHLELLCCNGCIMGPGMSRGGPRFARQSEVARFVRERLRHFDRRQWEADMAEFSDLDLSRTYCADDRRMPIPPEEKIAEVLLRMGKQKPEDELNCGACGYDTCRLHAIAVCNGIAESEMCLPYTIENLHTSLQELNRSHLRLASAKEALKKSERLASMGQLAAGIAHEVNNPLGVILLYSGLLRDEIPCDNPLYKDIEVIASQAERCKTIISGLLNFARRNDVVYRQTDAVKLVEKAVQSVIVPEGISVTIENQCGESPMVELDPDQMLQVLVNLIKNAIEAMDKGGTVRITVSEDDNAIRFAVSDTGVGIPPANREKLFEPFFTTKPLGKGSGLGLSVSYGIVKMHYGKIEVTSNNDPAAGPTGSTFTVILPQRRKETRLDKK